MTTPKITKGYSSETVMQMLGEILVVDDTGKVIGVQEVPADKKVIELANQAIAADTLVDFPITAAMLENIKRGTITVLATYAAGSTAGITADLYSSANGVDDDSEPFIQDIEPPFVTNTTKQVTIPVNLNIYEGKLSIKNLDAGQAVTVKAYLTI